MQCGLPYFAYVSGSQQHARNVKESLGLAIAITAATSTLHTPFHANKAQSPEGPEGHVGIRGPYEALLGHKGPKAQKRS